jgi:hypothetical protein
MAEKVPTVLSAPRNSFPFHSPQERSYFSRRVTRTIVARCGVVCRCAGAIRDFTGLGFRVGSMELLRVDLARSRVCLGRLGRAGFRGGLIMVRTVVPEMVPGLDSQATRVAHEVLRSAGKVFFYLSS